MVICAEVVEEMRAYAERGKNWKRGCGLGGWWERERWWVRRLGGGKKWRSER